MKNRAFILLAVFVMIIGLSSCGANKENSDVSNDASVEPSVSTGAIVTTESPAATEVPEISDEPSETPEESASPSNEASIQPTAAAAPTTATAEKPTPSEAQPEETVSADVEFSFKAGNISLTLRERDLDAKLKQLPFSLVSDYTEVLGDGSDTFTGSFLRTLTYDGVELTLFAPKDNEKNFWLMQMTTTIPDVQSYRGIKVGDSLETFLLQYPDAEKADTEDPEKYIYTGAGDDSYTELSFIISDNTVTQISLAFYLP